MKKSLRLLVLSGFLALMVSPVFADAPGGGVPPVGSGTGNGSITNSTASSSSSTTSILQTILTYLGL